MRTPDPVCPEADEAARGPGDDDDDETPIGDPDDDEDWGDDDDDDDDEEPLQVRDGPTGDGSAAMQHDSPNSGIINPLR